MNQLGVSSRDRWVQRELNIEQSSIPMYVFPVESGLVFPTGQYIVCGSARATKTGSASFVTGSTGLSWEGRCDHSPVGKLVEQA